VTLHFSFLLPKVPCFLLPTSQKPSLPRLTITARRPSWLNWITRNQVPLFVAQPPLPLQEFFPLHPLSLVLQPPWPLHSFCPLQACTAFSAAKVCKATPAWELVVLAAYARTAKEPVIRPATAAPAMTALDGLIICQFFLVYRWCLVAFATARLF